MMLFLSKVLFTRDRATRNSTAVVSRVTTTNMLHGHTETRSDTKSPQGKVYTKALSSRGAKNFDARKARQSHLTGGVALTEGFTFTGGPVDCRGIHAAARLAVARFTKRRD